MIRKKPGKMKMSKDMPEKKMFGITPPMMIPFTEDDEVGLKACAKNRSFQLSVKQRSALYRVP